MYKSAQHTSADYCWFIHLLQTSYFSFLYIFCFSYYHCPLFHQPPYSIATHLVNFKLELLSLSSEYVPILFQYGTSFLKKNSFLNDQSRPTLCDPMDCSPPGSSVRGILQERILDGVTIFSFRGLSWPRDQTHISCVSCIANRFFTTEMSGKPTLQINILLGK